MPAWLSASKLADLDSTHAAVPNPGDGDCLLYALDQGRRGKATRNPKRAHALRMNIAEEMGQRGAVELHGLKLSQAVMLDIEDLRRRKFTGDTYDDYIDWLHQDGNYMGASELLVAAELLSRCIVTVRRLRTGGWLHLQSYGNESHDPLFLKHHSYEHWEWLQPRQGS